MKFIHKISPVLILAGYFYILYEGYFLCQFGGVRYHGQKMAVGAAAMAVGFLFWLITRKKAKEQQAGKKQYLWIAELVAAGAATIICGAAVIRTAIPYNGALSWKIDEWRRINDESSSKDNSDTNKEENEPEIFSGTETETETKTSENIRNSDTWEFNAEAVDAYFLELRKNWSETSQTIVRVSQIENRILGVDGVVDVTGTKLNGTASNMTLTEFCIPKLGGVSA